MIQIYSAENKDYDHNGDMTLLPEECSVHVVLNGEWTATLEHPIDDEGRWKYINDNAVVKMPSFNGEQLFRIKNKEKREANLNTIIDETDRLNNLVNDILSLSIIESKMLVLNKEKFNLTALIETIIKRYEIFTTTLEYKFILDAKLEVIVNADRKKIEQVVYNLINNAINYTGDDKTVYIRIYEKNGTLYWVQEFVWWDSEG